MINNAVLGWKDGMLLDCTWRGGRHFWCRVSNLCCFSFPRIRVQSGVSFVWIAFFLSQIPFNSSPCRLKTCGSRAWRRHIFDSFSEFSGCSLAPSWFIPTSTTYLRALRRGLMLWYPSVEAFFHSVKTQFLDPRPFCSNYGARSPTSIKQRVRERINQELTKASCTAEAVGLSVHTVVALLLVESGKASRHYKNRCILLI